ncbi:MAG: HNH endonuclease [Verrucomicrobium sp.]|nr:HNH endonuclease [Verrucomicrobium sp.]
MAHGIQSSVLVLNRLWQAVNLCSARRAFTLLYQGHAQVVSVGDQPYQTFNFDQWLDAPAESSVDEERVRTIRFDVRVPKIILLLFFDRLPSKEVKFTRHNVFERDDYTCQYCRQRFETSRLNLDHVIPRERGGGTTWENIVCSCMPCNSRKGNRTPSEAHMPLMRRPRKPKWRPFLHVNHTLRTHESWRHFLDPNSWKVELSD